jgi:predicted acylesterase/phospholipase RssA
MSPNPPDRGGDDVALAKELLRGGSMPPKEAGDLANRLKQQKRFGYARRVLGRARKARIDDVKLRELLCQQHSLCTYKDPDLPAERRLDDALRILKELFELDQTKDPETLGLAGAIWKRKWEVEGQRAHLERSLSFYLRGHEQGDGSDRGYTGINAAFVLDLLADQEASATTGVGEPATVAERRAKAKAIREELVARLPALPDEPKQDWLRTQWWFLVTVAEAYFGLGDYDKALPWLKDAAALKDTPDWERESTARQMAATARLQQRAAKAAVPLSESKAWSALKVLLSQDADAVLSAFMGKVGLALSGGGFRASLFHIGVLARLAELDMLRHVEVLSCVSGGSIIGAYYYLEVRKLLQEKTDDEITAQDYLDLVARVEREFLLGVQANLRIRVIARPWVNLRMAFFDYSRTQRLGELYEELLFSRVKDGGEGKPRLLRDLKVQPKDAPPDFSPKNHNWRRHHKVPALILNATTINTGHNWQFTTSWMGESPALIDDEVDANYRLRRVYHEDAPGEHAKLRLGAAVGASSCVPGLLEPLALHDFYPDKVVRLIDGGVHDNQGIEGLLEQDCSVLLVSDASGQNGTQDNPRAGILGSLGASNNILMQRVREAEYHDLKARRRSGLIRALAFVHLKKDLDTDPIDWKDSLDRYDASDEARPPELKGPLTRYRVLKEVQRKLASIRTDLDCFNDAEAHALMLSAYRMTELEFDKQIVPSLEGPPPPDRRHAWAFLSLGRALTDPQTAGKSHGRLLTLLSVGEQSAFKAWRLSRPLQAVAVLFALVALPALAWWCWSHWNTSLLTVGGVAKMGIAFAVSAVLGQRIAKFVFYRDTLTRMIVGVAASIGGWLVALAHIGLLDRIYLAAGRGVGADKAE